MKTAILGGGLTGLTLGYLMQQRGQEFEILEKENECGGLLKTSVSNGFTFDCGGSHVLFSKDKMVLQFMLRLLGKNKIRNRRNTKVLYNTLYIKYPFENGLSDLPKTENFECLSSFITNFIEREKGILKKPLTLEDWCYYTFGKGIAEKYLIPYNKKIWKFPLSKMSLAWVERIPCPPIEDIIKSSIGITTEGYTHQLYFYYPRLGGIQSLTDMLGEHVKTNISTNFEIRTVQKRRDKWIISDGNEEKIFDKVVSTIPIQNLIEAMRVPKNIEMAVRRLKFNSLITVMIGLNKPKIHDLSWLYIPDGASLPHRISFPSNYSAATAPPGCSSVLAEITCLYGDKIWRMDDGVILNRLKDDMQKLRILDKNDICFEKIERLKYAYVVNDLNYERNIRIIADFVSNLGIVLLGRFAEFKYMNMDDCVKRVMEYLNPFIVAKDICLVTG